jgi:putative MATE family efflux protein
MGYNMNAGVLKGLGDSRSSLWFLFISCVFNIFLDLLFVAVFANGVAGVALATVLSQYLSWIISIIYIKKKHPELEYSVMWKKPDPVHVKNIVRIGLPLGFNTAIYSVGHLFVQALINTQGSQFMAGCSVATKVIGIANVAVSALSSAGATFSGQNYGARNIGRLKAGHMAIPLMSGAVTLVTESLVVIFRYPLLRLFSDDPTVVEYAAMYTMCVSLSYCIYAVFNGIINYAHGLGEVRYPLIINMLALWAVRIPSAWLISRFWDGKLVVLCYPISFVFGLTCMLMFYRTKKWKGIIASE